MRRVAVKHYGTGRVIATAGKAVHVLLDTPTGNPKATVRPKAIWAYIGEWCELDKPKADPLETDYNELQVGMTVNHSKFGIGIVAIIKPAGRIHDGNKAIIDFESVGTKTLLLNFAKLEIIR